MKVATRVAGGAGLLLVLLVVLLWYHAVQVGELVRANRDLGAVTFRAAGISLELVRHVDRLDESTRKLFVLRDAAYAGLVVETRDAIDSRLAELSELRLSGGEGIAVAALRDAWRRFPFGSGSAGEITALASARDRERTLAIATGAIEGLRSAAEQAVDAGGREVERRVREASVVGERAARVSMAVMVAALLLSGATVAITVRSIAVPLGQLVRGTREVARGSFDARLDEGGGDEFARVAADFNAMVERLGELDRLKREFVSHVSHELKTPLVAMQETTALLLDETPGPLTEKQRRLLDLDLEAARRLSRMISNLLDVSRIEAGAMEYDRRPIPIAEPLHDATAHLEAWARERRVTIELRPVAEELVISGDSDRLVQVIQNLLENAVKASPEAGTVTVMAEPLDELPEAASGAASHGPWVRVAVADRGPGIPDADKLAVFERFRQARRGRRGGGVGLGLAIARQLVVDQHGVIWVENNPGGGSVFSFALPRLDSPTREDE